MTIRQWEGGTQIGLSGFSLENEELGNFLNRLSSDPLFSDVQLKYARGENVKMGGEGDAVQLDLIHFHIDSAIGGDKRQ